MERTDCGVCMNVHRTVSDSINHRSDCTPVTMFVLQRPRHGKAQAQAGM